MRSVERHRRQPRDRRWRLYGKAERRRLNLSSVRGLHGQERRRWRTYMANTARADRQAGSESLCEFVNAIREANPRSSTRHGEPLLLDLIHLGTLLSARPSCVEVGYGDLTFSATARPTACDGISRPLALPGVGAERRARRKKRFDSYHAAGWVLIRRRIAPE